jgi:zinc D-Ala-D-Ala carboxypeptidase
LKKFSTSPSAKRKRGEPPRPVHLALVLVGVLLGVLALTACDGGGTDVSRGEAVAVVGSAVAEGAAAVGAGPDGSGGQAAGAGTGNSEASAAAGGETGRLHPAFSLSRTDLEGMTATLPDEYAMAILRRPQVFLEMVATFREIDADALLLVDKFHRLPSDYEPPDLVALERFGERLVLNRADLALRGVVLPDLFAMVEAARQEGIVLDLSSTYRSYTYQEGLFEYWVDQLGQEEAERVSARAGSSQHQLGTTIDFGSITDAFADHPAGIWLAEHAWKYGYSLSYPRGWEESTGYKYEPWHFRWISRPAAYMEREFFGGIQQVMLEFLYEHLPAIQRARTEG